MYNEVKDVLTVFLINWIDANETIENEYTIPADELIINIPVANENICLDKLQEDVSQVLDYNVKILEDSIELDIKAAYLKELKE